MNVPRQDYCSTSVLGHMASVISVGMRWDSSSRRQVNVHAIKERGREGGLEEEQHVSSGDVEARRVEEGRFFFLLCPLVGRGDQALLPLFLFLFSLIFSHRRAS